MDAQHGSPFSWAYFCQAKTMEELKHSLLCTTMELEQTKILVQEELRKRDDQVLELKELLSKAMKERDEAKEKYQKLFLEKLVHHHHQHRQVSSIEDEPRRGIDSNNGFSSSDCEESIVSSPVVDPIQQGPQATIELVPDRPLPEKGKLLQAVMKAGPLLQTLLLAGPLPQWRHPPPPLDSFDIPPVTIPSPPPPPPHRLHQDSFTTLNACGKVNRKRILLEGSDSPTETKYQRIVLH
ncbi:hypothetical protein ERO13_D03G139200v2 [Gossypium hirsutum]|uniref:Arp2/3 complex-activating protein rickA n=4 Tax=Gossypium TaxID=3633 RepID=A0A1U8LG17_GOSHI|nr:arp2/3 complex-activating protein rickA-like [Gossypium hirsutum]KAB2038708.1 hypothetical protein ES319_D03G162500v1 [Gossypium barbadense]KAG4155897.1 hypothetical protein ERO13_D03G139200v2 [Gossypium hirsutum]TYG77180.1 hypothetical protein ES288_D03G174000v1 [Gossypium darwinii]TYI90934.1 hypothetical protein E1A91_D03G156900v1 [Gossypium mustelinum]